MITRVVERHYEFVSTDLGLYRRTLPNGVWHGLDSEGVWCHLSRKLATELERQYQEWGSIEEAE